MEEVIRIPAERVKILVGKDGKTKELLEKKCRVEIKIDREGDVDIEGESTEVFFAKDVVLAIGRGFNPQKALKLLNPDYQLYIFHLKEYLSTEKAIKRIKGRIIGENGKTKGEIEDATDSYLSVYGNTVGIISKLDSIGYAQEAVGMLIHGAKHASAYNYLRRARKRILESRLRGK